jgi:EAL domain-containing protein (putative c-di-GMP-specific phosphodiesterase class I)
MLHVNISGRSIDDPRVAAIIEESILSSGIDPACLTFEVTETTAITNTEVVKSFADRLRNRGCAFAVDDFGAGFGSFYYLKSLAFDYFKIDGDFVRGIVANPMDQLVVKAIVDIARGAGRKTIAESVPDEKTVQLLAKLGVDYAQGYHVGMPRPLREVLPTR